MDQSKIRNFCIIAHIDHGKSTLADRLLEQTGTVEKRQMQNQLLDSMELEREKGITIKLQPVRMEWHGHVLNLIDTPGHVDFSYEVSRSLAACEGAILVVDAAQGIQAQTLANVYLAIEAGLTIIPVLNKIDLPAAEPDRVAVEIAKLLGVDQSMVLRVSAKEGTGVKDLLDRIVAEIPAPKGEADQPFRALVFDSQFDPYRGVILFLRVVDGVIKKSEQIKLLGSKQTSQVIEAGIFKPKQTPTERLSTGQIGYIVTNLKSVSEARVGDTVGQVSQTDVAPLPGYRQIKPFVYAGIFASSQEQYPALKDALVKLQLNDAALSFTPETSQVLGFGFRVGFLGLLHLEIITQRLEREYGLEIVATNPSTDYIVITAAGEQTIRSAAELPDPSQISAIKEPWIRGEIVALT